jgi:hypothetical protein
MMQNGFREDQVTQVRRFADQRLCKRDAPLDPLNRRISLIVQYQEKPAGGTEANDAAGASGEKSAQGQAKQEPTGAASLPHRRRNRVKPSAPSSCKTATVCVLKDKPQNLYILAVSFEHRFGSFSSSKMS